MKKEVAAYHLDTADSRYYGGLTTLHKSSLTENGD